jgi:polyphenol oxidase
VKANKRLALEALRRSEASLYEVWQVHSASIVEATSPRGGRDLVQADGMITDRPAVTLMMRFADCVPLVLYDARRHAAGLVHAGWLGTVRKAAAAAVQAMNRVYGSRAADLQAGIGPSIGPDHYEVDADVQVRVREAFGEASEAFLQDVDGRLHFDLWSANRWLLEREGVVNVEVAEVCTACQPADWFSHRGERGRTGRFGAIVALADEAGG